MKRIKFGDDELPLYIKNNAFLSQWCCKCGARHIWHFIVLRGRTKEEDEVFLTTFRDEKAEELRKFYERKTKGEKPCSKLNGKEKNSSSSGPSKPAEQSPQENNTK